MISSYGQEKHINNVCRLFVQRPSLVEAISEQLPVGQFECQGFAAKNQAC